MNESDTKVQSYVLLAKGMKGRAVAEVIGRASSDPAVFGFGELLDVPSVRELQNGDLAPHHALLQLFAYGTWPQYQASASSLPPLNEAQVLKLKQLTVVSLAANRKLLPYSELQAQLGLSSLRELEDFVINHCFYAKVVQGKLDQKNASLQVHDAIGRDVRPESLQDLSSKLGQWIANSEGLLRAIEARVAYATSAADSAKAHREELDARIEDAKKALKAEARQSDAMEDGGFMDLMDEDRLERHMMMGGGPGERDRDRDMMGGGRPERAERAPGRPKSRRR